MKAIPVKSLPVPISVHARVKALAVKLNIKQYEAATNLILDGFRFRSAQKQQSSKL